MEPKRLLTEKQLLAIKSGAYGKLTKMIRSLAETGLHALERAAESHDEARRSAERVSEFVEVRPEHERVLIRLTRPLGEKGLPAIEVFHDARVKVRIAMDDDELPLMWDAFVEQCPIQDTEIQVIPDWLRTP